MTGKAVLIVQNIENDPLPHADKQVESGSTLPRSAAQGGWQGATPNPQLGQTQPGATDHATPAPLQRRISLAGWAIGAVVSLGIWAVLIYAGAKLL